MNSTHHLGQTRRVAANCYDHKSTGHRLRHVPNFMSQIGPRDRLYVSTRTRFVSHGDVSPLAMVRGVTTFMSATTVVWDIKFVKEIILRSARAVDSRRADNHNIWEFSARVLATLGARGQEMSKSGQENRGYTPRNDGLSAGRSTFQAVRAHRHPPSPDSFVRPASVADGHRLATTLAADGPIAR